MENVPLFVLDKLIPTKNEIEPLDDMRVDPDPIVTFPPIPPYVVPAFICIDEPNEKDLPAEKSNDDAIF
jgi:hypothetical protein